MEEGYKITANALGKAQEAFQKAITKEGFDGAFWDIVFTAYILTSDLQRYKKVTIEDEVRHGILP